MKRFALVFLAASLLLLSEKKIFASVDSVRVKDTLTISLKDLELLFLKNNYTLLAQKYNIDMAGAAVTQAKLWFNPTFFYENVLYNPNNHHFFDNSYNGGERMAQLSKLVALGGKRSKLIRLAETNKQLETFAFHDLLRILRFQLYADYALVYGNLKKITLLDREADKLWSMVEIFKAQYRAGAIAGYEVTRIEYETQSVAANINDLTSEILEAQTRLRMMTLLGPETFVNPLGLPIKESQEPIYKMVLDSALQNRPDLKVADTQVNYSERSLSLERARAIPDLTVGTTYDRVGNNFRNYTGINVSMNLPFFNRNQGNIRMAEVQVENSKKGLEFNKLQVFQDVDEAYIKLNNVQQLRSGLDPEYIRNLAAIQDEAIKNYNRRVISLLDFMDKLRTYKNGQMNLIDLDSGYFLAQQYLNFVSNTLFY